LPVSLRLSSTLSAFGSGAGCLSSGSFLNDSGDDFADVDAA
jgi:hypothetical protein